jgi:hypothetical protein
MHSIRPTRTAFRCCSNGQDEPPRIRGQMKSHTLSLLRWGAIVIAEACAILLVAALLPLRIARRVFAPDSFQCLWTGTPIITMALKARAERHLGFRSRSLVTHTYYITDAFDIDLSALRAMPVIGYLVPFCIFLWTCLFVDRLHFYCDRGILPVPTRFGINKPEFMAYRLLRIQLFLWTYGSDVRTRAATRSFGEPNCCSDCTQVGSACVCGDVLGKRRQAWLQAHARAVFSMGDMIEYTPGSRNDLFFWPLDLSADNGNRYRPVPPDAVSDRPLRVVHAPNHAMFKGTRYVQQAVEELRREGVAIELVMVQKVPNQIALDLYRSADVIFDQCLAGFHGYFALEGMALGKPVMCFIRKPSEYLLHPEECPIVNTHLKTLKDDLRQLASDRPQLAEVGRRGRRYIERYFTVEAFAQRLRKAYVDLGVMA